MKAKILLLILCTAFVNAKAQDAPPEEYITVFGFGMADMGYSVNQVNPQWYDVMRPSKLPAVKDQFGANGNYYASARQSRFGIKTAKNTDHGQLKIMFDFDMFGVGADAGQTTIRLRHAYGQLGHFAAGQLESAFMDVDVFPNTLEYWGPNGMLFYRNVQVRWMPIMGPSELVFALEMPGASADAGVYADRVELSNLSPHFPAPDFSGHYRSAHDWGYVQLGFMARYIGWEDMNKTSTFDLTGNVMGWGVSLSSNIKAGANDVFRLQVVEGAGVENYFNDAPVDVGIKNNFSDTKTPVKGEALGDLGVVAFLDHSWNEKWTSSVGYSMVQIDNSDGQAYDAYKKGQYIAANLLYSPVPNVLTGVELTYIDRENYKDGFTSNNTRINFSFKYSFSQNINK